MIIAASMMQVYAADTQYINGVSVEEADYSNACLLNENVSEGIARGIEPRGSIIDTALTRISNLGKGDIGILIQTVAHVECDKIKILQFVIKVLSGTAENGLIDKWSGFN